MKKSKKPAAKKSKKAPITIAKVFARQLQPQTANKSFKQLVRVVRNCKAELLVFDTVEDVNTFLFQFDQENHGKDPSSTGTWIDLIITNVYGDVFDIEQLEA